MSEQDNVDVVRQLYSDFGEGNVDGILNVLTEDNADLRHLAV